MGVIGERAHSRSHRYPDLEDFATARKIEYFEIHRVVWGGGPVTSGAQG